MVGPSEIFKANILIVDDEEPNVSLLEEILRGARYVSVASTRNPREVCELHLKNRYDLILLDLQMPGMDGFQVMEALNKIETDGYLPVLAITAQPDHKLRALKAGARDFVTKPFDLAEVLIRVYNMVEVRLLHLKSKMLYERVVAEQKVSGQLLAVFRSGPFAMSITSVAGTRIIDVNDQFCRLFGYSREEVVGESAIGLNLWDSPEEQVRRAPAAKGAVCSFDAKMRRKSGELRDILGSIEMIELAGESGPVLIAMLVDITDRKRMEQKLCKSEERFKFVARAVSDVVWDWDLSAGTLWWNDGFLTTFGFAAGEIESSVEAWAGLIHPEERDRVVDSIHQAVDSDAESWSAEYRFRRKDGSYAFVQDRSYILRTAAGRGVRMVGGIRDLTEQKKMEEQYLRSQRMDSIGTLAAGVAHDLNNVLAPIMMSIELLKLDSGNDPRREKILDTISVSSRRGADLVRQVLSFARGLDGKRVIVQLRTLINDLDGIISETFPTNIQIVIDAPNNLHPITADPTQIHQVLLNLVVNARDAMPQGGTLTLAATNITIDAQYAGTSQDAKAGPYLLIEVTDTGTGIPLEVRGRIFEPFFTTKEFGRGTGIGLATVHAVVKSHGGFLNFESEIGRGTTFRIYLPADPTLRAADLVPARVELPRGRGEVILVVDDEPAIRDITRQTLELFGYRLLTARDGAEAIALYAKHAQEIAVVLTDMMMPVMDGASTIQVLRRMNPLVRIIASSGLAVTENVAKAIGVGVHDFLPKPFTAEVLLRLVREVLDRPAIPPPAEAAVPGQVQGS